MRAFLGVPRNATTPGVMSEVDWLLPKYRTQVKMLRQYHRLVKSRLKKIFQWDKELNSDSTIFSWSSEVKMIFDEWNLSDVYNSGDVFPLKCTIRKVKDLLFLKQQKNIENECRNMPKLRTFVQLKEFNALPAYITKPLSFIQRKYLGSLEIRIKTGRFSRPRLEESDRICQL